MSEPQHIVALATYGRQTFHDTAALKCSRVVPDILLTLFPDCARELPLQRQTSYRYIALQPMPTLRKDYLVLKLTEAELHTVEALTRAQTLSTGAYLWRDKLWYTFPHRDIDEVAVDYQPVSYRAASGAPLFEPHTAQILIPSQCRIETTTEGLTFTPDRDWWWVGGETYPHREQLKAAGARWSARRKLWYFPYQPPQAILALSQGCTQSTPLGQPDLPLQESQSQQSATAQVVITNTPDSVDAASPSSPTMTTSSPAGSSTSLPQAYIGRVNVVGDCFCFGVALDRRAPNYKNIPIYLSVAGPATSVEAVWAKLSQAKQTSIIPDGRDQPAIFLEPNQPGLYKRFQRKLDALGITHLILVHQDLAEPCYPAVAEDKDPTQTYVLCTSDGQRLAKVGQHVRQAVKVVVFEPWFPHLYAEGLKRGLLRPCIGHAVEALALHLDTPKWTQLITDGLRSGTLRFPA